jgi:hypothetical protein
MTNCRAIEPTSGRPSGPLTTAKRPIRNEPETLTQRAPREGFAESAGDQAGTQEAEHASQAGTEKNPPRQVKQSLVQLHLPSVQRSSALRRPQLPFAPD